jgi:RNA polymerase sigma-70 factor, ECF subfamily
LAWEQFVALYTPLLWRWSRRTGLNDAETDDLVQDIFVKLLAELPRLQCDPSRGRFRSWWKTVTVNECRARYRRAASVSTEPVPEILDDADSLTELWDAEYRGYLAGQALQVMQARFEPTTWQAAWQMIVHEQSAAETGQQLGLSEAAVYVAKSRLLRRLRQELGSLLD